LRKRSNHYIQKLEIMAKLHAYLNFNGNCEEAFNFYEKVFNTKNPGYMRYGDIPADPQMPPVPDEAKNKICHTAISINGDSMLMGADVISAFGQQYIQGNNSYVMLMCESTAEAKTLYDALSTNAKVVEMPLGETFFAELYSAFQDQFGICWMVYFGGNKEQDCESKP
jgi:PhnB protein